MLCDSFILMTMSLCDQYVRLLKYTMSCRKISIREMLHGVLISACSNRLLNAPLPRYTMTSSNMPCVCSRCAV